MSKSDIKLSDIIAVKDHPLSFGCDKCVFMDSGANSCSIVIPLRRSADKKFGDCGEEMHHYERKPTLPMEGGGK